MVTGNTCVQVMCKTCVCLSIKHVLAVYDHRYQSQSLAQTVPTVPFVQPADVVARFLPRLFRYHPLCGH